MRTASLTAALLLLSSTAGAADRAVLVEIATGAWCGYCPDVDAAVDELRSTWGSSVVIVRQHEGDAMATTESEALLQWGITGFPSVLIDRQLPSIHHSDWASDVADRLATDSGVAVSVAHSYDPVTRALDIDATATFEEAMSGNLRVNVLIVEDGVTGSGSGFDQISYYDTTEGHPYEGAGNVIAGFVHDEVARADLDLWGGIIGSGTYEKGQVEVVSHTWTVPASSDPDSLRIVAFVLDFSSTTSRTVRNAVEVAVETSKGELELSDTLGSSSDGVLDFGYVRVGESAEGSILGTSPGAATIGAVDAPAADAFEVVSDTCAGATVTEDSPCETIVRFTPTEGARIISDMSVDGIDFVVEGVGSEEPTAAADAFVVLAGEVLDIPAPGLLANDLGGCGDPLEAVLISSAVDVEVGADGSLMLATAGLDVGSYELVYAASDAVGEGEPVTSTVSILPASSSSSASCSLGSTAGLWFLPSLLALGWRRRSA